MGSTLRAASGYINCYAKSSVSLVDFAAVIAPSNDAAQPFLSRDAQRLRLASPPDVRAVFAVPQTATRGGSSAGARRCFALLALRTDP